MSEESWSIDELARRAAAALAAGGVRAPNGRVSAAPDRRVIRWYATIGLLDRPLPLPGRAARYGPRHLLQLVAVKRRQAEGRSLAAIQAELTGATDDTLLRAAGAHDVLRRAAGAPDVLRGEADPPDLSGPSSTPVVDHPADEPVDEPAIDLLGTGARPATGAAAGVNRGALAASGRHEFWRAPAGVAPVYPVPLPGGAELVLRIAPTGGDLAAIEAAARPLLDLLAARGLVTGPEPGTGPDPAPESDPEPVPEIGIESAPPSGRKL